jgi:cellulose synthase/poly-beta-1,6-N-acetylglucosamine synthase-like glycosyltransferase
MTAPRDPKAGAPGAGGTELLASVVVPHYNDAIRLRACLASLEDQTLSRARYEVIVADNGTPGGIADVVSRFPRVRFVEESRKGAAHARNAAIAVAGGAVLAFIDADCVAEPAWLEEGVRALEHADLVGGAIRVTAREHDAPTPVELFEMMFAFRQQQYVEKQKFAVTANLFAKRTIFDVVGGFRDGLPEDTDWCWRAGASGYAIRFAPRARVAHPARHDWAGLVAKWERLVQEKHNAMRHHPFFAARWVILALLVGASSLPHGVQVLLGGKDGGGQDLGGQDLGGREAGWRLRLASARVLARIRLWRTRRMLALLVNRPASGPANRPANPGARS